MMQRYLEPRQRYFETCREALAFAEQLNTRHRLRGDYEPNARVAALPTWEGNKWEVRFYEAWLCAAKTCPVAG